MRTRIKYIPTIIVHKSNRGQIETNSRIKLYPKRNYCKLRVHNLNKKWVIQNRARKMKIFKRLFKSKNLDKRVYLCILSSKLLVFVSEILADSRLTLTVWKTAPRIGY